MCWKYEGRVEQINPAELPLIIFAYKLPKHGDFICMFEKQTYLQCASKRVKITSLPHLAYRASVVMPHNIEAE